MRRMLNRPYSEAVRTCTEGHRTMGEECSPESARSTSFLVMPASVYNLQARCRKVKLSLAVVSLSRTTPCAEFSRPRQQTPSELFSRQRPGPGLHFPQSFSKITHIGLTACFWHIACRPRAKAELPPPQDDSSIRLCDRQTS